jgi:hypothetical protein
MSQAYAIIDRYPSAWSQSFASAAAHLNKYCEVGTSSSGLICSEGLDEGCLAHYLLSHGPHGELPEYWLPLTRSKEQRPHGNNKAEPPILPVSPSSHLLIFLNIILCKVTPSSARLLPNRLRSTLRFYFTALRST